MNTPAVLWPIRYPARPTVAAHVIPPIAFQIANEREFIPDAPGERGCAGTQAEDPACEGRGAGTVASEERLTELEHMTRLASERAGAIE